MCWTLQNYDFDKHWRMKQHRNSDNCNESKNEEGKWFNCCCSQQPKQSESESSAIVNPEQPSSQRTAWKQTSKKKVRTKKQREKPSKAKQSKAKHRHTKRVISSLHTFTCILDLLLFAFNGDRLQSNRATFVNITYTFLGRFYTFVNWIQAKNLHLKTDPYLEL